MPGQETGNGDDIAIAPPFRGTGAIGSGIGTGLAEWHGLGTKSGQGDMALMAERTPALDRPGGCKPCFARSGLTRSAPAAPPAWARLYRSLGNRAVQSQLRTALGDDPRTSEPAGIPAMARGQDAALHAGLGDEPTPADSEASVIGRARCAYSLGIPYVTVHHADCTTPCTVIHESVHAADMASCCWNTGVAHRKSPVKGNVELQFRDYLKDGRDWFEVRAYRASLACAKQMYNTMLCGASPDAMLNALVLGGGLVGGVVGGVLGGGSGAASGGTAGLGGGPAAPATVPAGMSLGFYGGGYAGIQAGAVIGGVAGAAAEGLRRDCCARLAERIESDRAYLKEHKTKAGAAPARNAPKCPFGPDGEPTLYDDSILNDVEANAAGSAPAVNPPGMSGLEGGA